MNVLFVIHYPVFGGPHNQARLLAPALAPQGVTLTVLLPDQSQRDGNAAVERLRSAGVDVVTVPLERARATRDLRPHLQLFSTLPRNVLSIRRVIRERRIDVVQVGGLVNPHAAVAARLENVATVWQILDTRPPMSVRRALMPLVTRLADVVMTTGLAVAASHPGATGLGDRLHVFFPPADAAFFDPDSVDAASARRELGFTESDVVLGSVGNLNPQKGHEYLLRAAALARATRPETRVLVVGASHGTHAEYEGRLHALTAELGLVVGRDVIFAGGMADVRQALAAMDVFVLASVPRSEGAPTAIEEAMMMRLPVVATDVGAVREVVEDGRTGLVVRPLDPRALADAIVEVLGDDVLRARFASRARERAVALFSTDECARAHLAAYEHALRRLRARRAA